MKYSEEIIIHKPVKEVVELFNSIENLYQWMDGLEKFESLGGTPGQPGAKSKLIFGFKNRKMEMIETITVNNLPDEFSGTYDAKGVHNVVKNFFKALPDNKTSYRTEQEFHFKGFMKFIAFLMPGAFRKQTKKHLLAFKNFAERN